MEFQQSVNLSLVFATMGLGIISLTVAFVLAIALGFGVMLHFGVVNHGLELCPRHAYCLLYSSVLDSTVQECFESLWRRGLKSYQIKWGGKEVLVLLNFCYRGRLNFRYNHNFSYWLW